LGSFALAKRVKPRLKVSLVIELGQVRIGFDRRFFDTAAITPISVSSISLATGHYSLATRHPPLATYRPAKIGFVRLLNSAFVRPKLQSAND
jgi:hypothetical protein